MNEETLTTIHTQLDEAAFVEAWEQGRALTVGEAVPLALDSWVERAESPPSDLAEWIRLLGDRSDTPRCAGGSV